MDDGLFFSDIFNINSFPDTLQVTLHEVKHRSWIVLTDPVPPETEPTSETMTNGLPQNNQYVGVVSLNTNFIIAFGISGSYTLNVDNMVSSYNNNIVIVDQSDSIVVRGSTFQNDNEYTYGPSGIISYPSKSTIISGDVKIPYIRDLYTLAVLIDNSIIIKTPTGVKTFGVSNGVPSHSYNSVFISERNDSKYIHIIHSNGSVVSLDEGETNTFFYPIAFNFKNNYDDDIQNVKVVTYNVYDLIEVLYNSSYSKRLLLNTVHDGVSTNFLIVQTRKSNLTNSIWYVCGDDGRHARGFKAAAGEFGIEI